MKGKNGVDIAQLDIVDSTINMSLEEKAEVAIGILWKAWISPELAGKVEPSVNLLGAINHLKEVTASMKGQQTS